MKKIITMLMATSMLAVAGEKQSYEKAMSRNNYVAHASHELHTIIAQFAVYFVVVVVGMIFIVMVLLKLK